MKRYSIRKHCDDLWSELIKLRAGSCCEKCGSKRIIQGHHIISRTNWNLRFDPMNGLCLCRYHHIVWIRQNPIDYSDWLRREHSDKLEYLEPKRFNQAKHDYTLIKLDLENEIKKLK